MRDYSGLATSLHKLAFDLPFAKTVAAATGGIIGYVFREHGTAQAAVAAAVLIGLDTITGVAAAAVGGKEISSRAFARTLVKILGYASVVLVCAIAGQHVPGLDSYHAATVTGVVTLVILTEAISILENVHAMGVSLPFGLSDLLKKRLAEHNAQPDEE